MIEDAAVMGLLIASLLVLGALISAAVHCHRTWTLYARFAIDWQERADLYTESLLRMADVHCESGAEFTSQTIEMFRNHDKKGLAACSAHARNWREKIPKRFRTYYLRSSRWTD